MSASRLPGIDPFDRRLNVPGQTVESTPARITAALADLRREPRGDCPVDHQLLCGEAVAVFDEREGWSLVKASWDGYVGWTSSHGLGPPGDAATHVVCARTTFVYPGPDLKFPATRCLSLGSLVTVVGEAETRNTRYSLLAGGEAVVARHLRPADSFDADYVAVAERLLHVPYLWGGSSGFGVDCSGHVQLAMRMCGRMVLRDSDMQAASLGEEIDPGPDYSQLRRGDLVFWRGHVAIAQDSMNLLHANGYTMDVASEPTAVALARIGAMFEQPIGCRRP